MGSSADGIVYCACGSKHWGRAGAAGVLAWRDRGEREVILQLRAEWSMSGGTWGIPGGAIGFDETPLEGAIREAHEEAGLEPARVWAATTLTHPDWSYTTVVAEAAPHQAALVTDHESDAMEWVPWHALDGRVLMPAFEQSVPLMSTLLGRTLLVVDPSQLESGWEYALSLLGMRGIGADVLPAEYRDAINHRVGPDRTVTLFPDIAVRGSGRPLTAASYPGTIAPTMGWTEGAEAVDMGAYDRVVTVGGSADGLTIAPSIIRGIISRPQRAQTD